MSNKYSCPKCDKKLSEADVVRGICPYCHKIFDSLPRKTREQIESEWSEKREVVEKSVWTRPLFKVRGTKETLFKMASSPPSARSSVGGIVVLVYLTLFLLIMFFVGISESGDKGAVGSSLGFYVPIEFGLFMLLIYKIKNYKKRKYWMWTIECPQCGWIGEPSHGWLRDFCPRCSWDHVIQLGWRRRE